MRQISMLLNGHWRALALMTGLISCPALASPSWDTSLLGLWTDQIISSGVALGVPSAQPFRPATGELALRSQKRVQQSVTLLRTYSSPSITNQPIQVTVGDSSEPNAFSSGCTLYITQPLLNALNDRELLAVVAHEIAHAELGHPVKRLFFPFSAGLVHLGNLFVADWNALSSGEVDAYMEQILKEGQVSMIQTSISDATLGQEIEADTLAAHWIRKLAKQGFQNRPEDLIQSIEKLTDTRESYLMHDPVFRARIGNIRGL